MKKIVNFLADEIKNREWSEEQIDGLKMALFPGTHRAELEPAYKRWLAKNPQYKDVMPMSDAEINEIVEQGL